MLGLVVAPKPLVKKLCLEGACRTSVQLRAVAQAGPLLRWRGRSAESAAAGRRGHCLQVPLMAELARQPVSQQIQWM